MDPEEERQQQYEEEIRQDPTRGEQLSVGTRELKRKERLSEFLTEMLKPSTQGFEHVNLDMSFSNLDRWDLYEVRNQSHIITLCKVFGWKRSEFLQRGDMATILNTSRSKNAKSMDMMTTIQTKSEQEFQDKSDQQGFSFWPFGKNKNNRRR